MSWLKNAVSKVGEKAEAIKQSERFQKLQEKTSVVVASAAESVKRAREKIGRTANAIEFEAQLENRAKTTRTVPAIQEMHKTWAQSIVASGNKEGPRVSEGDHDLGFKEMFLQSRALENSLEVIISEPSLREHYMKLPTADDSPVAALHELLSKSLAFPAAQWQGLVQVAMSGILSGDQVTWILSIVTAMKNDWNEELLSSERKDLAMKAEVLKQELKPLALSDTEEHAKKRIDLSTQLLLTYQAVQQNLNTSGEHRDEVRQMRENDLQHVLQQVQARIVNLQSHSESSSCQRKELEGELNQSQESLKMQLSHLDEVRTQIDKEIEELDERKRQLRIELDDVSRQLDEARMKQKQHMEKSDKHRNELYSVKASIQEKISGASNEAANSEKEKELLDQTRKILEDSAATLQTSVQEQQVDLKQKLVDFQEHFKALLADHLRFCEVKARQLQSQAESSVTEANKELLLSTARAAEEALDEFQKSYAGYLTAPELQTQLGHLRDAYGKTLKILGAAPTGAAGSDAAAALLEPMAPEAAGYPASSAPII